jgi:hypothetical protein
MSKRRPRIFADFDRQSARKIEELMRWRWPDSGGKPPVLTEEQQKAGMQETREKIRHAYLLAEVRSYLGIDEAAFWRRVEKRAEKRVENNDKPESKAPSHNVTSYLRWQAVVEARREGLKRRPRKGTWLNAYAEASKRLAGRPAGGTPRTMKRAYIETERLHRAAKVGPFSPT